MQKISHYDIRRWQFLRLKGLDGGSVLNQQSWLASTAVTRNPPVGRDLADRVPTTRAREATLIVYFEEVSHFFVHGVRHTFLENRNRFLNHLAGLVVDQSKLVLGQRFSLAKRVYLGLEKDLIRIRVADA